MTQAKKATVGQCGGRGCSWTGIEKGQLTEHLARALDTEEVFAAIAGRDTELDLAFEHDVETIATVAFGEDHATLRKGDFNHRCAQSSGSVIIEGDKQRSTHQDVSHLSLPASQQSVCELHCATLDQREPAQSQEC